MEPSGRQPSSCWNGRKGMPFSKTISGASSARPIMSLMSGP